jgi:hypothetical protein
MNYLMSLQPPVLIYYQALGTLLLAFECLRLSSCWMEKASIDKIEY